MRKVLLLAAAAIMIPGAVSAQSMSSQAAGSTAAPMANDSTAPQGDMMNNSATAPSTSADSASSAPTASDAGMPAGSSTMTSATDPAANAAATDTASPSAAMNKTYPMCSRTIQDSCRNRGGK